MKDGIIKTRRQGHSIITVMKRRAALCFVGDGQRDFRISYSKKEISQSWKDERADRWVVETEITCRTYDSCIRSRDSTVQQIERRRKREWKRGRESQCHELVHFTWTVCFEEWMKTTETERVHFFQSIWKYIGIPVTEMNFEILQANGVEVFQTQSETEIFSQWTVPECYIQRHDNRAQCINRVKLIKTSCRRTTWVNIRFLIHDRTRLSDS